MYKAIATILTPFVYAYVWLYNVRAKSFGYNVKYNYLPASISTTFLPVIMDLFWFKRGFFGRNLCLVPKGRPYSDRFDSHSPYFQTWVGTYSVTSFKTKEFKSEQDTLLFLANAAIEDQNAWLISYGVENPNCRLLTDTLSKVEERDAHGFKQVIYYGEMESDVDDAAFTNTDLKLIHLLSAKVAAIYNGVKVNNRFLMRDKIPYKNTKVNLFGYYSFIQVSSKKYLVTYVCGTKEHKHLIDSELMKVMRGVEVEII